ncbi:hypothetical protein [Vibrio sp. WXL103]|uniref:hypothetical protein n=1 Tax=Vibrio sp. WXL103 TaxID=3450710 RepID=UPI003EC67C77
MGKNTWQNTLELARYLSCAPSILIILPVFFYALFILLISFLFGLGTVCGPDDICVLSNLPFHKEVGYAATLNWFLNSIIILPCLMFFLIKLASSVPTVLQNMSDSKMLINSKGNHIAVDEALSNWKALLDRSRPILAVLLIVAITEPIIECIATSSIPLFFSDIKLTPEGEFDWSVAAILRYGEEASWYLRLSNGVFVLLVFFQQSFMIAAYSYLLYFSFLFVYFFQQKSTSWKIIPRNDINDDRMGFQVFEEPIMNLLICAVLALCMQYFSILQNHYLRTEYTSISSFLNEDIITAFTYEKGGELPVSLINPEPSKLRVSDRENNHVAVNTINFSVSSTTIGGILIVVWVLGIPVWVLRGLANRGKNIYIKLYPRESLEMNVWPLKYLTINVYLVICIFAVISLTYYRVGLFLFGIVFTGVVARMVSGIIKSIESPD